MATLIELARKMRPLIVKAAQSLTDEEAVQAVALYDEWSGNGVEYAQNYKVRRNGKVYKVITAHTSQADWAPEVAASQWKCIDETHAGTANDPIPYDGNMELMSGLYYVQDDILYLCIRDTGNPVYHALKDLIGLYVEVA